MSGALGFRHSKVGLLLTLFAKHIGIGHVLMKDVALLTVVLSHLPKIFECLMMTIEYIPDRKEVPWDIEENRDYLLRVAVGAVCK